MTEENHGWGFDRPLLIKATAAAVWPHIGEARRLSRWWCPPPTALVCDPPRRLVIQRSTNGRFGHSDQVDIFLDDLGSRTRVQLNHSFDDIPAQRRGEAHDFYADGWTFSLGLLNAEVVRSVRGA